MKKKLTLSIEEELIIHARNEGINVSKFLTEQLRQHLKNIRINEGNHTYKTGENKGSYLQHNSRFSTTETSTSTGEKLQNIGEVRTPGFEPGQEAWRDDSSDEYTYNSTQTVKQENLDKYFALREINGISERWLGRVKIFIKEYLDSVNWNIEEMSTLQYFNCLRHESGVGYYRKKVFQIRKFLKYLGYNWADNLHPPKERYSNPMRVTDEKIQETLNFFNGNRYEIQLRALVLLGADTGMRPEEIYQVRKEDIDLENRTVYVKHDPKNNQTTKTGKSRVSFFTKNTAVILKEYLTFYDNHCSLKKLFSQRHCHRHFKDSPIQVKYLRKYFSQKWDRNNGNYHAKEMILGHSMRRVDFQHYSILEEHELKEIYDKVMMS